jgi:hypothetical protein
MLTARPDVPPVIVGMVLSGIGVGLTIPTLMGTGLGSLPASSFATGSGVINMVRQAFMAIGVALLIALLGAPMAVSAKVENFHTGWWVLAALSLLGLAPTLLWLRAPGRVGRPALQS